MQTKNAQVHSGMDLCCWAVREQVNIIWSSQKDSAGTLHPPHFCESMASKKISSRSKGAIYKSHASRISAPARIRTRFAPGGRLFTDFPAYQKKAPPCGALSSGMPDRIRTCDLQSRSYVAVHELGVFRQVFMYDARFSSVTLSISSFMSSM